MSRELSVGRYGGPAVPKDANLVSACIDHRLYSEDHASAESDAASRGTEVRNVGVLVKVVTYSVTDVLLNYGESVFLYVGLDRVTDVTEPCALLACRFDSAVEGFASYVDQALCLFGDLTNREGIGTVAVEAAVECTDIDFYDIALLKKSFLFAIINLDSATGVYLWIKSELLLLAAVLSATFI